MVSAWIGVLLMVCAAHGADDAPVAEGREIPPQFAPFEYLLGSWKGTGQPTANRVRGWDESHAWAWKFEKGKPSALSVTMKGNRVLSKAQLAFDGATQKYTLGGSDPRGKPVAFAGRLDKTGKRLTIDRLGPTSDGAKQQLTLFPNSNFVRYSLWISEQERGAPQFKRTIEAGLTKEGEAFAAGSTASNLPKCIVTGGAATMTVSYQGKSFPLCCTGCRDEFNENPEKYIKKAALLAGSSGKGAPLKPSARPSKDDGSFDGLLDEPKSKPDAPDDGSTKAAALLRLGQNLEKARKPTAALAKYRQIVEEYPNTPAARSAAERIKALTPP
jgi:YHS domain-containing protein